MIELKNVFTRQKSTEKGLEDYSLIVRNGDFCLLPKREGLLVIKALLGFIPVASGFVTYDGMPLTASSAPFLRKMIAYIPSPEGFEHVVDVAAKQREMVDEAVRSDAEVVLAYCPISHQSAEDAARIMEMLRTKALHKKVVIVATDERE